jgi:carboxymethylenebutenolidase
VWNGIISKTALPPSILAAVCYGSASDPPLLIASLPCLQHLVGDTTSKTIKSDALTSYRYPSMKPRFAIPGLEDFDYGTEAISHTRNLTFLKKYIRGADFDLEAIWEEHCYFEFDDRPVAKTMGTMVQEPHVNHIPTVCLSTALSSRVGMY